MPCACALDVRSRCVLSPVALEAELVSTFAFLFIIIIVITTSFLLKYERGKR